MTTVPQPGPVPVRYGLASRDRERHWTAIVDGVLGVAVLVWLVVLAVDGLGSTVTLATGALLGTMTLHRLLLLAERRRTRSGAGARS